MLINQICFRTLHLKNPASLSTYLSIGGYDSLEKILKEKINDIAFRNILNSRSMLLEQPDYKKQRKIHSEEGKDDEQTD